MRWSLSIARLPNHNRSEFHRVILPAEPRGAEQESQNLRIGFGRPARHAVEQQEHQQASQQTPEEVKRCRTETHGEEEQLSLGTQNGERPGERPVYFVHSSGFRHGLFLRRAPASRSRKEPREEVHRGDGHPDTEKHACENPLRAALAKSESESGNDDGNERESARDRAGEGGHENIDGVLPRGIALLGKGRDSEQKYETNGEQRLPQ